MRPVYIVGVGMMRFGKFPDRSIKDLAAEAVSLALADAGAGKEQIETLWFANSGWGTAMGQDSIRGQVALRHAGIDTIPIVNVENACAGGSTALNGAYLSVASGAYDIALAVGAEKVFHPRRLRMFAGFLGGLDVENISNLMEQARTTDAGISPPENGHAAKSSGGKKENKTLSETLRELGEKAADLPQTIKDVVIIADRYHLDLGKMVRESLSQRLAGGKKSGNGKAGGDHSPFMDVYAYAARHHMKDYGSTQRQLALIASKNHHHASQNPLAQIQKDLTVEQVLADKSISWPLTRAMCAPVGDGAAAAVVCSGPALKKFAEGRAVKILASVLGSGKARGEKDPDIGARVSRRAYDAAGLGPSDIHLAEVHDATAFGELHQSESLGFCEEGMGGVLAESGATKIGGRIPLNTSGGLESRGHPIGASGIAQVYEVVQQLRGTAGKRQVEGARIGLTQNGGGALGVEEAAMTIHILEGPPKRRVRA